MKKKLLSLLMGLYLLLSLVACGKGDGDSEKLSVQIATSYTVEEVALPIEQGQLHGCCTDRDALYGLAAAQGEEPVLFRVPLNGGEVEVLPEFYPTEVGEGDTLFYRGPILGGDGKLWIWEQIVSGHVTFMTLRQLDPATGRELCTVDAATLGKDAARLLVGLTVDKNGNIYVATTKEITVLNKDGQVIFTLKAEVDAGVDGTLALLPEGNVIALVNVSETQREVRTVDFDIRDWGEERYMVSRSTAGLYSGSGAYRFFSQRNGALYGRLAGESLDTSLLSWDAAGLEEASSVDTFALLEDGRVILLADTVPVGSTAQQAKLTLRRLTPSDRLPWEGKTRLVYGTIGDDGWARRRVNKFNAESDTYYIELRDYAEGMLDYLDGSYLQIREAAQTRLVAEILAGRVPDILDDRGISLVVLARQGVLTDLWPMIEGDPELGREGVMEHVLECAETSGKLYRVFSNFRIDTMAASAEAAAGRTSWTLEEMLDAYGGKMPEVRGTFPLSASAALAYQLSADELLYALLRMDLSRYVDWETGACSFDSEAFRNTLLLCGSMGGDSVGSVVIPASWDAQPVVYWQCLGSVDDLNFGDIAFGGPEALLDYEALLEENGICGRQTEADGQGTGITDGCLQDAEQARETSLFYGHPVADDFISGALDKTGAAAYIGFPTSGSSGSSFRVEDCLAIAETCADKEGAWQFVRQLLLPGGSLAGDDSLRVSYDAFPVNRADFERLTMPQPEWFTDEAGNEILDQNGERIERARSSFIVGDPGIMLVFLRSVRQEQVDRLMALYNAIDHIGEKDEGLTDLIREQAGAYFAGEKALDETVKLIQNRAMLYVGENIR